MKNMTSKGKKIQSKKTHQAYCFVPEVQKNSRSWLNLHALHEQNSKRKGKDDQALISGCRNQCPCQRLRNLHPKKNQQTTQSDHNILENFHQTQSINIKIPRPFWNEQPMTDTYLGSRWNQLTNNAQTQKSNQTRAVRGREKNENKEEKKAGKRLPVARM